MLVRIIIRFICKIWGEESIKMLNIVFYRERYDNIIHSSQGYFFSELDYKVFETELARKIVYDIEQSKIIINKIGNNTTYAIDSPYLGLMPIERLSGGVKSLLILLDRSSDVIVDIAAMGDNCVHWLEEISKIKDITILYEEPRDLFEKGVKEVFLPEFNVCVKTYRDLIHFYKEANSKYGWGI